MQYAVFNWFSVLVSLFCHTGEWYSYNKIIKLRHFHAHIFPYLLRKSSIYRVRVSLFAICIVNYIGIWVQDLRKERKRLKKKYINSHEQHVRQEKKYIKRDKMIHDDALKETNTFVESLRIIIYLAKVQDIKVHIK